jgi:serine/threonine protein phosphatase PrpC
MAVRARLRSAFASDTGRRRTNNEDRYYVDAERGIFAVIDGVGGHAAGEHAAEAAVEVLRERLERQTGTPEERLREAIALANNEIYRQSRSRPEWNGMACVLTIALIEDDIVTVGHVGDSRLYLLRPGEIRKMTHDHSPVGEREDRGEITEAEAMRHARRNEIYRDVGSSARSPDDPAFIEIASFPMPPDSAILLCSDGLTDLITGPEIRACLERYAPDYEAAIRALIDAANNAGGKDNITVVVVAAPEYKLPAEEPAAAPVRYQPVARRWPMFVGGAAAGIALGAALGLLFPYMRGQLSVTGPRTLTVGSAGINAALNQAHSGDTVVIPQGKYTEQIQLREGVTLRAQQPADVTAVTIASPDGGPAVIARNIETGSIEGVTIQGDPQSPASAGIQVVDASPDISYVRITGMVTGIEIRGASAPHISSSQIENNLGAGIDVQADAKPNIENSMIAANGNGKPGAAKPGVEVGESARPVLKDNAIVNNGAEPIWVHGHILQAADFEENFFGELPVKRGVRLIDEPAVNEKAAASEKKGKGRLLARP